MSALDGRIRSIAREEAEAALSGGPTPAARESGDEVAELSAKVEALTARLDELESATATPAAKRPSRKTAETTT